MLAITLGASFFYLDPLKNYGTIQSMQRLHLISIIQSDCELHKIRSDTALKLWSEAITQHVGASLESAYYDKLAEEAAEECDVNSGHCTHAHLPTLSV